MKGKYITMQIWNASLSHKNNNKPLESKQEKVADLSQYTIVWKKKKARQEEILILIDF